MIRLGLTGGIGSGKSVAADFFRICGIPVYDCDMEAKCLMAESSQLRQNLIDLFGSDTYKGNVLNRAYLAGIVFNDPSKLGIINSVVHPAVRNDYRHWCTMQRADIIVIESAILFDSGLYHEVDKVLSVTAPEQIRIHRVMRRDSISEGQVKERMRNQMSEAERIQRSNFVVVNDESVSFIEQLNVVIDKLRFV